MGDWSVTPEVPPATDPVESWWVTPPTAPAAPVPESAWATDTQ